MKRSQTWPGIKSPLIEGGIDMKLKMGVSPIRVTLFGGPYNEDYSVLGPILGSPILGN